MTYVTKLNIGETDYNIVDTSVPSWAKYSTKSTFIASEIGTIETLNITEMHKSNVNNMTNIQDIELYNITTGYPEKLHLSVEQLLKQS